MEHLRATPEAYAGKIEFLKAAITEGAHKKLPKVRTFTEDNWVKVKNIGAVYNGTPDVTMDILAGQYGIWKQQVSVYCRKFIEYLHGNCSKETQEKYPLETIPIRKPMSQALKEKNSSNHGGLSLKIREQLIKGVTKPKQIAKNLNSTSERICSSRHTLKSWGIDFLLEKNKSYRKIKDAVEKETDDQSLQELLDSFSGNSLKGICDREDKGQAVFAFLGNTLRELGFDSRNAKFVLEELRSLGIPIRRLEIPCIIKGNKESFRNYHVFYVKHKQRIIRAIGAIAVTEDKKLKKVV